METTNKIKAIITGATGMVGEGVLHQCLLSDKVEAVLVINRKPCGITHPKLKEIIHADFFNLAPIQDQLDGYDACFFCLGVSSVGMSEENYYKVTYLLTMHVAEILSRINADMTFCYISGAGTESTENGRSMWARVKGKTENDLMKLPFKQVFNFRPGFMKSFKGAKNTLSFYKYISWMYPIGRLIYPKGFITLEEVGKAMINTVNRGTGRWILDGKDIVAMAKE